MRHVARVGWRYVFAWARVVLHGGYACCVTSRVYQRHVVFIVAGDVAQSGEIIHQRVLSVGQYSVRRKVTVACAQQLPAFHAFARTVKRHALTCGQLVNAQTGGRAVEAAPVGGVHVCAAVKHFDNAVIHRSNAVTHQRFAQILFETSLVARAGNVYNPKFLLLVVVKHRAFKIAHAICGISRVCEIGCHRSVRFNAKDIQKHLQTFARSGQRRRDNIKPIIDELGVNQCGLRAFDAVDNKRTNDITVVCVGC